MEIKFNTQVTVFDAPTTGFYTVRIPDMDNFMTVRGPNGIAVANQLTALFPTYQFVYEKDKSYVYDAAAERLVKDREASAKALFDSGTILLEQTLQGIRREINIALDEDKEPDYRAHIDTLARAFGEADRYFWILENRSGRARVAAPAPTPKTNPSRSPKSEYDYDGDRWDPKKWKHYKDIIANGFTKEPLPFGVGYGYVTDMKDIDKVLKQIEEAFAKKP
jgi:hypothetical protein